MRLLVASANVEVRLPASARRACLDGILAEDPDIVGLQEFFLNRARTLGEYGKLQLIPGPVTFDAHPGRYVWTGVTFGDCVVGLRAGRFAFESAHVLRLSRFGRAENPTRPGGIEPPRRSVLVRCRDLETSTALSLISFHMVPGVQSRGAYRSDRPKLVARHRAEAARLDQVVSRELRSGRTVLAMGDSNFDGFAIPGLTSAWAGHDRPGTHGKRTIDDVFGPGRTERVWTIQNASDHDAVLALREIG
ncbi:MAG TPA: endonuclease/exonuclease/phosphatase family protein [Marmoricola sp.]